MKRNHSCAVHHLAAGAALAVASLLLIAALRTDAADQASIKPSSKDKCPVCGMFVSKYPDWTSSIVFKDGLAVYFDGAKDLFKYLADPGLYTPGRPAKDIESIFVRDYYSVQPVNGRTAYYVAGSDVSGPMGRELIAFGKESDAREFLKDHNGRRLLRFHEVTAEILRSLDK